MLEGEKRAGSAPEPLFFRLLWACLRSSLIGKRIKLTRKRELDPKFDVNFTVWSSVHTSTVDEFNCHGVRLNLV